MPYTRVRRALEREEWKRGGGVVFPWTSLEERHGVVMATTVNSIDTRIPRAGVNVAHVPRP